MIEVQLDILKIKTQEAIQAFYPNMLVEVQKITEPQWNKYKQLITWYYQGQVAPNGWYFTIYDALQDVDVSKELSHTLADIHSKIYKRA